jgi:hypothetical protein
VRRVTALRVEPSRAARFAAHGCRVRTATHPACLLDPTGPPTPDKPKMLSRALPGDGEEVVAPEDCSSDRSGSGSSGRARVEPSPPISNWMIAGAVLAVLAVTGVLLHGVSDELRTATAIRPCGWCRLTERPPDKTQSAMLVSNPQTLLSWSQQMVRSWWGMFGLRAPWSGDVRQAIDTSLLSATGTQLGFININEQAAGNAELEQSIVTQGASYGRQLGRITDALIVLMRYTDRQHLTVDERAALDALLAMRDRIDTVKEVAGE